MARRREVVGHAPDVGIHAEQFVYDDDGGGAGLRGFGDIGRQRRAVGDRDLYERVSIHATSFGRLEPGNQSTPIPVLACVG